MDTNYAKKIYHLLVTIVSVTVVGVIIFLVVSKLREDEETYRRNGRDIQRLERELKYR